MSYLIAETTSAALPGNTAQWQPTKAKTLAAAKRAARRRQGFQGTYAHVALVTSAGAIHHEAVHEPGRGWRNLFTG